MRKQKHNDKHCEIETHKNRSLFVEDVESVQSPGRDYSSLLQLLCAVSTPKGGDINFHKMYFNWERK